MNPDHGELGAQFAVNFPGIDQGPAVIQGIRHQWCDMGMGGSCQIDSHGEKNARINGKLNGKKQGPGKSDDKNKGIRAAAFKDLPDMMDID